MSSPTPPPAAEVPLVWKVGHSPDADSAPLRWVPAAVPGAVQLDWARAEGWPDYWYGDNFRAYAWMEDVWWTYRAAVPPTPVPAGHRLLLRCAGVDYDYLVSFDGHVIHTHEGMFTAFEVDLTAGAARGGCLEIRLKPAPKAPASGIDRTQARLSAKPPVAYGWDWHPRLIPLGIWDETRLSLVPDGRFTGAEVTYSLDVERRTAEAKFAVTASGEAEGAEWRWQVLGPDGGVCAAGSGRIADGVGLEGARLSDLDLWWPHDQGAQPLYTVEFSLLGADGRPRDRRSVRTGFRRMRLVMHEGAWEHPADFPKSRSSPPFTLEVNGRAIFCRGSNWVPPEIFPGTITRATYQPLLELARRANFNLLRSWGGGIVNKESFFELCDELGLMVWQEFPLACNCYEDDPHYLRVLDAESRAIIRRVRSHPSLAMWSGGNELFNSWSGMTDQSWALRLLNRNCYELDPATPFIPTSPVDGVGHGDYRFRDEHGREVHQIFATATKTAYTEFGCPGPSPVDYLRRFIPPEELWPVRLGTAWETHHGLKAWFPPEESSWLCPETIAHYFGAPAGLEELVAGGEWLQGEGYKVLFEEARRQKPRSSMALNWCYNEPWPSAANNSLINWPCEVKPAFHAVAAACRPVMPSARIPRFLWHEGEEFEAELWLLNDSPEGSPAGIVEATLLLGARELPLAPWSVPASAPNRHVRGPTVRLRLPSASGTSRFTLRLVHRALAPVESTYLMPLRPPPTSRQT